MSTIVAGVLPLFVALAVHDLVTKGRLHSVTLYGALASFAAKPALVWLLGLVAS